MMIARYFSCNSKLKSRQNAPERLNIKRSLFATMDAKTRPDLVIASSSLGLPSSELVTDCKKNPSRIPIGYPFNLAI